jgi:hypothetical protein
MTGSSSKSFRTALTVVMFEAGVFAGGLTPTAAKGFTSGHEEKRF